MKIKSIELRNNPILGDLDLNFCDVNGVPFDTILIAGENGTGKSTIQNIIYDFLNVNSSNAESNERQTFVLELNETEISILRASERINNTLKDYNISNEFTVFRDYSLESLDSLKTSISKIGGGSIELASGAIINDENVRGAFKSIFSDVEVNYTPSNITSTTSLDIDTSKKFNVKSTSSLATEITQLLIDIEALDSSDFAQWARENPENTVSEGITDKRMRRFKNAFDFMFTTKRFNKVSNTPQGKKVYFEDMGKLIPLNDLSSGEKQIVFRGSFLLRDKSSTSSAIVLLDEPEISLHPKWQIKILDFYKRLFLDDKNNQTSQLIVATHSPFVIHNKNQEKDKIIVLEKNRNEIYLEDEPTFYDWKPEEAIKQAFDIDLDYNFEENEVVVFVEGFTDESYINKALEIFGKSNLPVKVQWIGREEAAGPKFTGETALNQTKEYLLSNHKISKNKFLLLYDSDTNKRSEDFENENLYIRKAPKNEDNKLFEIGVENLLTLPSDFPSDNFYTHNVKKDNYGGSTTVRKLEKVKLCDWICDDLDETEQKIYLSKIESEIISIIEEVNNKKFN